MKIPSSLIALLLFPFLLFAQHTPNGRIDQIEDLATLTTVPFEMPDGTQLMTDIYLPVLSDCLMVDVEIPGLGSLPLELIPRGTQLFLYDSLNGRPNPNPYQLPMIFVRTPYSKSGENLGWFVPLLGYGFIIQDMRGRYESEGAYLPMYSDSWSKRPYHPDHTHALDITEPEDPRNGNRHEDGYNSIEFIRKRLLGQFDLDRDGFPETEGLLYNGSLGMFGASALGNTQYQAAAAHRIDPFKPGLKCIMPVVATNEHYNSTGFHNGVFRQLIVSNWLQGQLRDLDDSRYDEDLGLNDNIHSARELGQPNKAIAGEVAIDHLTSIPYGEAPVGAYPNSPQRADMDASQAKVDKQGEGNSDGSFSRYTNMEVPAYHITGWWDIFVNGQIETWQRTRKALDPTLGNKSLQKLVIGPWAHQTIGTPTTGGHTYPDNVGDVLGINLNGLVLDEINISEFLNSEVVAWYRYNLNFNPQISIGLPSALIPESHRWQDIGFGHVRVPARDYKLSYLDILNYLSGKTSLMKVPGELTFGADTLFLEVDLPPMENPILIHDNGIPISEKGFLEFRDIANVRFYVAGPVDDGVPENSTAGNYWFESDEFPISKGIDWQKAYLHARGGLDASAPQRFEGKRTFLHDPDEPVLSAGGNNMLLSHPAGGYNHGQVDYQHELIAPNSMDRADVISHISDAFSAPLTVIGYPEARLFAASKAENSREGDPMDTDFFVRILDVYPDGRELFVVEGAVNARAREYAKSLVEGEENIHAPFSNIESGEIYEYHFQLLPLAYTWGKGHKMKVLISSSNYPRYQSNPGLPIEEGAFFRRKPGDGEGYTFQGEFMLPRKSLQSLYFSSIHPTHINLPVYDGVFPEGSLPEKGEGELVLFPNPTNSKAVVSPPWGGQSRLILVNALGKELSRFEFEDFTELDVSGYAPGFYVVKVIRSGSGEERSQKLVVRGGGNN